MEPNFEITFEQLYKDIVYKLYDIVVKNNDPDNKPEPDELLEEIIGHEESPELSDSHIHSVNSIKDFDKHKLTDPVILVLKVHKLDKVYYIDADPFTDKTFNDLCGVLKFMQYETDIKSENVHELYKEMDYVYNELLEYII